MRGNRVLSPPDAVYQTLQIISRGLTWYCVLAIGLALYYMMALANCRPIPCDESMAIWLNSMGLAALLLGSVRILLTMVRRSPSSLWTPGFLYPTSTLLFFGIGSASILYADDVTRLFLVSGAYAIDANGLLRTSALTFTGVAIATTAMVLVIRAPATAAQKASQQTAPKLSLGATAIFFLAVGITLKYALVLPAQYGLLNVTVSGTLKNMTNLIDLGFAVVIYMVLRGQRSWFWVFCLLWPMHLGVSMLEFSKKVMMFAILLPAAGAFLAHQDWRRLIPWIVFAGLVYSTVQNVNSYARLTLLHATGSIGDATLSERVGLLQEAWTADQDDLADLSSSARTEAQVWWLRLNYSGAQLRAMELYDVGIKGDWTLSVAATVIPRFLWPDKPIATAQGRIFNRTVTGNAEARTRIGMSVYADGYWQMGWAGTLLFSALMGVILGFVTRVSARVITERQLIYFPVVFIGMQMAALGPLGYFQKSFVAALPIFLGYILLISWATKLFPGRKKTRPRGAQAFQTVGVRTP